MVTVPALPFDPVVEHAVERLSVEFVDAAPPSAVRVCVAQARLELSADPPAALPELVERLARVRIEELLERAADRGRESPDEPDRRPCPRATRLPTMVT
jgi:hypothetical protein